jgi:hypothetical protein
VSTTLTIKLVVADEFLDSDPGYAAFMMHVQAGEQIRNAIQERLQQKTSQAAELAALEEALRKLKDDRAREPLTGGLKSGCSICGQDNTYPYRCLRPGCG